MFNRAEPRDVTLVAGLGARITADGRGQIKRLILIVGMGLLPFLVFAQSAGRDRSAESPGTTDVPARESGAAGSVDESTLVLGSPSGDDSARSASVSAFGFWDFVRMILVLGCVVGIIYLIFYFLKRAGSGKYAKSDLIRVVGSQSLPGNRAIYLVQVGAQVFMVGAGGDAVTLLGEITDKETVDTMILAAAEEETPRKSFGDLVASLVKGGQGPSLDLMRQQRERLQRLREQPSLQQHSRLQRQPQQ